MHKCTKFGLCEVDPNVLYHFNTVVTSLKSVTIEQVVKSGTQGGSTEFPIFVVSN